MRHCLKTDEFGRKYFPIRAKHQIELLWAPSRTSLALVDDATEVGPQEGSEMLKIAKILCVIDPTSEAQPALVRCQWLAKATGAGIELLICHDDQFLTDRRFGGEPFLGKERQELLYNHSRHLEKLAAPIRAEGTTVWTAALSDLRLHKGVVKHALERKVDIVLKDTHHHPALSRVLFTHSDWSLIRNCPMPLWLVKPCDDFSSPTFIAAIDPLHANDKPAEVDDAILRVSRSIAEYVDGELHVFHAYDPRLANSAAITEAYMPLYWPNDVVVNQIRENCQQRVEEIADSYNVDDEYVHVVAGVAHEELPRIAESFRAAVVVMGAVARNALERIMIGATAERTLERLPCDLLIVKPAWLRSPRYERDVNVA